MANSYNNCDHWDGVGLGTPTVNANTSVDGTAEDVLAANATRKYLFVQNVEASGGNVLWVRFGADATAAAPAIRLEPGAALELSSVGTGFCPTGRVSCIGSGAGTDVSAMEA